MKKIALGILLALMVVACNDHSVTPEKPEKLLTEDEMVDILYDITLLQSMRSFKPQTLNDNNITTGNYVYAKYDIDSTTFVQNHNYYATQLDVYDRIHKRVTERIKKEKEPIEEAVLAKAKQDSIDKAKNKITEIDTLKNSIKVEAQDLKN
ncbi:DUF4296 domain-containing protein [Flavobacterium litorale]|uniref:DUF4296 domain-containing protein n=1 Tax=Flavobacterium litorale TaxID=2856519 RepID=A0ABX8V8Z2_9FLAO|nr:DUF4296 domain-containing protein [Flavobacterium litorale]QYJ69305.1 DUF4296 domain-containing protein [Flavobacterium litorale]